MDAAGFGHLDGRADDLSRAQDDADSDGMSLAEYLAGQARRTPLRTCISAQPPLEGPMLQQGLAMLGVP